jgi:hypothetical protein
LKWTNNLWEIADTTAQNIEKYGVGKYDPEKFRKIATALAGEKLEIQRYLEKGGKSAAVYPDFQALLEKPHVIRD